MRYAIIGFGKIGTLLLSRLPEKALKYPLQPRATRKALPPLRPRLGQGSFPRHSRKRSRRTSVFLAVRFESHPDVAKALPNWKGKTIVDVTNAYGVPPEKLRGLSSSKVVLDACAGTRK